VSCDLVARVLTVGEIARLKLRVRVSEEPSCLGTKSPRH